MSSARLRLKSKPQCLRYNMWWIFNFHPVACNECLNMLSSCGRSGTSEELRTWFLLFRVLFWFRFCHIIRTYSTDAGAITWLPQSQESKPKYYDPICYINPLKNNHSKTKHNITIFRAIYCIWTMLMQTMLPNCWIHTYRIIYIQMYIL